MFLRRFLSGLLPLCWAASALAGPPEEAFTRDLATAREEAYVMPGETVRKRTLDTRDDRARVAGDTARTYRHGA